MKKKPKGLRFEGHKLQPGTAVHTTLQYLIHGGQRWWQGQPPPQGNHRQEHQNVRRCVQKVHFIVYQRRLSTCQTLWSSRMTSLMRKACALLWRAPTGNSAASSEGTSSPTAPPPEDVEPPSQIRRVRMHGGRCQQASTQVCCVRGQLPCLRVAFQYAAIRDGPR